MSKAISVQGVSKVYGTTSNEVTVLKDVNFSIESGTIATLYGPSGSGKSTILNLVSGLDAPTKGSIYFDQEEVSCFTQAQWTVYRRQHTGFIFQNYNLFPSLSALENVEIIGLLNSEDPRLAREKALTALQQVGLEDKVHNLPSQLSGGQQQRVAVARAIASGPAILFADEPTANLDSKTARSIIELLFDLNKRIGTTILFSTHDQNIIDKVHRVIRVKDGEIQAS